MISFGTPQHCYTKSNGEACISGTKKQQYSLFWTLQSSCVNSVSGASHGDQHITCNHLALCQELHDIEGVTQWGIGGLYKVKHYFSCPCQASLSQRVSLYLPLLLNFSESKTTFQVLEHRTLKVYLGVWFYSRVSLLHHP